MRPSHATCIFHEGDLSWLIPFPARGVYSNDDCVAAFKIGHILCINFRFRLSIYLRAARLQRAKNEKIVQQKMCVQVVKYSVGLNSNRFRYEFRCSLARFVLRPGSSSEFKLPYICQVLKKLQKR